MMVKKTTVGSSEFCNSRWIVIVLTLAPSEEKDEDAMDLDDEPPTGGELAEYKLDEYDDDVKTEGRSPFNGFISVPLTLMQISVHSAISRG